MAITSPPEIGRNIMNQRKLKGMSLDELSKRSGVSKSMLSQIEQDKTNPTVITVWKIAKALDISIKEIMESSAEGIIEVIRSSDAQLIFSEDRLCTIKVNTPIHLSDDLELYQLTLKQGGRNKSLPHYPGAEEFLTVIKGIIKIASGDNCTVLHRGDTARYRADVDHVIENVSEGTSEAYLVVHFPK